MPTGNLVKGSGVPRHILQNADECLAWAQREYGDPQRCQIDFWGWATGVEPSRLRDPYWKEAESLLADSADWPWFELHRIARRTIENLFIRFVANLTPDSRERIGADITKKELARAGKPFTLAVGPHHLLAAQQEKGRAVVRWLPDWPGPAKPWEEITFFLNELFMKMDGASAAVVGRCRRCGHWFIRSRIAERLYCSDSCRNASIYARRKEKRDLSRRRRAARKIRG